VGARLAISLGDAAGRGAAVLGCFEAGRSNLMVLGVVSSFRKRFESEDPQALCAMSGRFLCPFGIFAKPG
jgi:hypothetical protein